MPKTKIPIFSPRQGYDQIVGEYRKTHNYLDEFEQDKLMPMLGDISNLAVLDAGAGAGRLTKRLARAKARVTALDISAGMLGAIRKHIKENITTVIGDVEQMPFADGIFDLVISAFVIVHLSDPGIFFQEARRVLKDGGRLLVGNVNQKEPVPVAIGKKLLQIESYYHSREEVVRQLEELAFKIEKVEVITEQGIWINQLILASK